MRRIAATILTMESIVIALAVPVAAKVSQTGAGLAAAAGAALVVSALVIAALLRFRAAYVAAAVWHLLVIATGVVVPAMFFLGAVFAALWGAALWLGRKHETRHPDGMLTNGS